MTTFLKILTATFVVAAGACATAPQSASEQHTLQAKATTTIGEMTAKDPNLHTVLSHSTAYVVFPEIGKAGFIVGGGFGRGVLYEHGTPTGYVKLTQLSGGLEAGAQGMAELIVLNDPSAVAKVKAGEFTLGANLNAVVVRTGAAAAARFVDGVAVFQMPRGGLMAEASVSGQKLSYEGG
jgi:lipid-binding SYLF domain-containing protein